MFGAYRGAIREGVEHSRVVRIEKSGNEDRLGRIFCRCRVSVDRLRSLYA